MTDCDIIRDLLPLYHDKACSPASRALVDDHVASCAPCREVLTGMSAPLPPPVNSFLPPPSRLKEAKRALTRRAALAVMSIFCALGLFIASGVALYTAFEKERVIPWSQAIPECTATRDEGIRLAFAPERYVRASCLFRRLDVDGEERDVAILQLTQTWARKYFDTNLSGPAEVAMGTGTGLYLARGGQKHDAAYGPEYEPAYWDPRWAYPGTLTEVYYLESPSPLDLRDAPAQSVLDALARGGHLLWQDGTAQ